MNRPVAQTDDTTNRGLFAVVVALVGFTYLATAARTALGGDTAEFATIGEIGGVAHPSGYPLYTLLLRAGAWLPAASPAHRASLITAVIGIAVSVAMYAACRAYGVRRLAAATAVGFLCLTSLTWRLATQPEVFCLNLLMTALILWGAAPGAALSGARRIAFLGLVAGLGLSNHLSIVLVAPIGIWGVVRGWRESQRPWIALGIGAALLFAGLLPYLQIAFASAGSDGLVWGQGSGLGRIVDHFLRRDYGTFELGGEGELAPMAHLARYLEALVVDWAYVGPAVGLLGIVIAWRANGDALGRMDLLMLMATALLAGPIFVLRFNLPPEGLSAHVVERFYLMSRAPIAVLLAVGIDRIWRAIPLERPAVFELPACSAVLTLTMTATLSDVMESHRPDVEDYLRDTLWSVEEGAVILSTGDHRLFGFPYIQRAIGIRNDVVVVDPVMMHYPWYLERIEERLGWATQSVSGDNVSTVAFVDELFADGREVYVTNWFSEALQRAYPSYPIGTLMRILPDEAELPSPLEVEAMNDQVFAHFMISLDSVPADSTNWSGLVRADYARPWLILEQVFTRAGYPEKAEGMRQRAELYAPWL